MFALSAGGVFAQEKAEEKLSAFEVGIKKTKAPENAVVANYSANVLFTTTFGKATKRMTDREMPEAKPAAGGGAGSGEDDSGFDFAALEEPTDSTDVKRIETAYAPRVHFKKTVKSDNSVEEEWFVNGFYITKSDDANTAFIHEPGANGGKRSPKEGIIPDMDWVNAQSFIGTGKYKGQDVYIFEDWSRIEIISTGPQMDIDDETLDFHSRMETTNTQTKRVIDKSRSRPNARVYVDPATMLPIAKETAYMTEFYEFASIPGGLTTPPDVRAQYHGFINRSTDLTQKYGLPQ